MRLIGAMSQTSCGVSRMLDLSSAKKIYLYPGVTDMRLGLIGLIQKVEKPEIGCVYVFCNKSHTKLKILEYQNNHAWLYQKNLFRGKFTWPKNGQISAVDLAFILFVIKSADTINNIETNNKVFDYAFL